MAERAVQEVREWLGKALDDGEVGGMWFVGQMVNAGESVEAEKRMAGK